MPAEIRSRDGLTLVSYLSLPKQKKPNIPIPMVLLVHGGPIGIRDNWGLDTAHQYLANRGYAVLSVNYRGSGGFGKSFVKAAYGEYAGKMHDDLIDAVNWAIKEKIADPKKVAIMGGSYGGYAALVGATMTPDVFACAVSCVGMSNLITFMETIPPYWRTSYAILKIMLGGDYATLKGKETLKRKSPLTYVNNIKNPLLILHGLNNPRVKKSESDQIVNAMKKNGIPVSYVIFPDEGHGWDRRENQLADAAITEAFLSKHLGGKLEPLKDEVKNSSMQVLAGNVEN
jgi:dipeptidyl aminopeptidase/acylaminoacyl peptidase